MSLHSVRTHSGVFFDFVDPKPETVKIEDIARALSRKPRFNGHMNVFYSVAQHAWLVSHLAQHIVGEFNPMRDYVGLAGLHHDDSEYVMADVPTPLKRLLPEYKVIERRVMDVINPVFSLPTHADEIEQVKWADTQALFLERDEMIDDSVRWSIEDQHPGFRMKDVFPDFQPWDSERAMSEYLARHEQLMSNMQVAEAA